MMRSKPPVAWIVLAVAGWVMACGGAGIDGGQSGTGISAVRGNVVAAPGTTLDVAGIRVSLADADATTRTDANGRFELRVQSSGAGELLFERESDGLFARTDVVVPAGGVLELSDIVIDPDSGQAEPTVRRVEFEGFVTALDCAGGAIFVAPKEDEAGTAFTIEVASATIRHDNQVLACGDLRVGDRVQVVGRTSDGYTLVDAEVVLEDREDQADGGS